MEEPLPIVAPVAVCFQAEAVQVGAGRRRRAVEAPAEQRPCGFSRLVHRLARGVLVGVDLVAACALIACAAVVVCLGLFRRLGARWALTRWECRWRRWTARVSALTSMALVVMRGFLIC